MSSTTRTIKMRKSRREVSRRNPRFAIGIVTAVLISILAAGGCLSLAYEYASISRDLPSVDQLPVLLEAPDALVLQPTRFYDRSGQHLIATIQNPAAGERKYLFYPGMNDTPDNIQADDLLPGSLISATIAASGIETTHPSFLNASQQLLNNRSSLSERLADEFLLQSEPESLHRTIRQKILGAQIIHDFGPEKVIEWYLNNADFGKLAYGAETASHLYFGKPAHELSFSEASLLLAIQESIVVSAPDKSNTLSARQAEIVQEALRLRLITAQQGIEAIREKPAVLSLPDQEFDKFFINDPAAHQSAFTELALEQVTRRIPYKILKRGGLKIYTTMDYDLQTQCDCTAKVQQARTKSGPASPPVGIPANCPAARLLPTLTSASSFASEGIGLESVIIDPLSGQILALNSLSPGGEPGLAPGKHPIGTLGSAFIYMTGFTRGLSPATLLWDIPGNDLPDGRFADLDFHSPVRLRAAFANDYLAPASSVLIQVGEENVFRTTQQLGIEFPETEKESDATILNHFRAMDLVEISHAFGVFANLGSLAGRVIESANQSGMNPTVSDTALPSLQATTVLYVEDTTGQIRFDWRDTQSRPILTPALAYLMTNVLSDETARWPSLGHPNPLEIGRPAAAKIGSDPENNSSWVIGYTPKRVVGVWIGSAHTTLSTKSSSIEQRDVVSSFWHAIMQYSNQSLPYEDFPIPSGLKSLRVCDPSGLLPTAACPNVVDDIFLDGNEPAQLDRLYRLVSINRNTNELATIFTPPDLVEERSYLIAPANAQKWASQAGWETPPETYDPLPVRTHEWADTQITSPEPFAAVHGKITITGRASGADFSFFRLQFGKGPNPDEWFQLGTDIHQPVSDGKLATWDATLLDGLYAVQLLLVRNDQSAERATILITVDNQPPNVKIIRPFPDETVLQSDKKAIVLQTEISDNLQVTSVELKIDGHTLAILSQPPYSISWVVKPGAHVFSVIAIDRAGNQSRTEVNFNVE